MRQLPCSFLGSSLAAPALSVHMIMFAGLWQVVTDAVKQLLDMDEIRHSEVG